MSLRRKKESRKICGSLLLLLPFVFFSCTEHRALNFHTFGSRVTLDYLYFIHSRSLSHYWTRNCSFFHVTPRREFSTFFGATFALFFLGFGFVFYKADFSHLVKTFIRISLRFFRTSLNFPFSFFFMYTFLPCFFTYFFAFFPFLFQPSKKRALGIWVERRNNRFVPNSRLICVRKWKNSPFSLMQKKKEEERKVENRPELVCVSMKICERRERTVRLSRGCEGKEQLNLSERILDWTLPNGKLNRKRKEDKSFDAKLFYGSLRWSFHYDIVSVWILRMRLRETSSLMNFPPFFIFIVKISSRSVVKIYFSAHSPNEKRQRRLNTFSFHSQISTFQLSSTHFHRIFCFRFYFSRILSFSSSRSNRLPTDWGGCVRARAKPERKKRARAEAVSFMLGWKIG